MSSNEPPTASAAWSSLEYRFILARVFMPLFFLYHLPLRRLLLHHHILLQHSFFLFAPHSPRKQSDQGKQAEGEKGG